MIGRNRGVRERVAEAAGTVAGYVDPLVRDEKLRRKVAASLAVARAAQRRARRQAGLAGLARRLGSDPVLRAQLNELVSQLQGVQRRARKTRSHKLRNSLLFAGGVGMVAAAIPSLRNAITSKVRRQGESLAPSSLHEPASIVEEIEIAVPVTTAYNQWTQFEEFPRFMEGVDEVRQLDDTLLHWAVTIGGKHAEWDAKITEQEPDRRITWESTDGKRTRGTVSFEEAGPEQSRVRLQMSYTREGVAEKVGSAVGLDRRRVRADLERFRDLMEGRGVETGAWRGKVKSGTKTGEAGQSPGGS
jgi:uncharacterized membrane protein